MLVCYSLGIFTIVIIIFAMIVSNIFLLQINAVDQVESTRDKQANQDLLDLTKTGSQFVYAEIQKGVLSMNFIQQMLIDMFNEETFALEYSKDQYEFSDLNQSDLTENFQKYGNHKISFKYPTYYYLNKDAEDPQDLKNKVSRFIYFFENLLLIYSYSAIRYIMYFEETEFVYFYPGLEITDYHPTQTVWYQSFISDEDLTTTKSYNDLIGNSNNQILSVVIPLYNSSDLSHRIGVICGDWLVPGLYQLLENITYLGHGFQYLVYNDGSLVDTNNKPWLDADVINLNNLIYSEYWKDVLDSPTDIHYLIEAGNIWRTATAIVGEDSKDYSQEWNFLLVLVVKESDLMNYKEDAKVLIKDEGLKFILITVGCSIFTSSFILYLIYLQAKNISRPIQGIIDFTYKLNTEENDEIENELHELEEGTDQTAQLVLAYKELARNLINKKHTNIRQEETEVKEYPLNELKRLDKDLLLKGLEMIPKFHSLKKKNN